MFYVLHGKLKNYKSESDQLTAEINRHKMPMLQLLLLVKLSK